jgi:hypothetical protein
MCFFVDSEHYSKFLAVSLVWHTAAELLLAMTDANAETNSKDWALVACIISHLALAYGNKQPVCVNEYIVTTIRMFFG